MNDLSIANALSAALSIAIVAVIVGACATPAILKPKPGEYPCGVAGVVCCSAGDICGGSAAGTFARCHAGACCYDGWDTTGPAPRMQWKP